METKVIKKPKTTITLELLEGKQLKETEQRYYNLLKAIKKDAVKFKLRDLVFAGGKKRDMDGIEHVFSKFGGYHGVNNSIGSKFFLTETDWFTVQNIKGVIKVKWVGGEITREMLLYAKTFYSKKKKRRVAELKVERAEEARLLKEQEETELIDETTPIPNDSPVEEPNPNVVVVGQREIDKEEKRGENMETLVTLLNTVIKNQKEILSKLPLTITP